jgi:hypothetical protein
LTQRENTKRWTKKAIKTLQGQLTSFVVCHRLYYKPEAIEGFIREKRLEVVLAGMREFVAMHEERSAENAKTADHFEANPGIYGKATPEMVQRFRGFAAEEAKDAAAARALVAKVEAEGLPPEVVAFDPMGAATPR